MGGGKLSKTCLQNLLQLQILSTKLDRKPFNAIISLPIQYGTCVKVLARHTSFLRLMLKLTPTKPNKREEITRDALYDPASTSRIYL